MFTGPLTVRLKALPEMIVLIGILNFGGSIGCHGEKRESYDPNNSNGIHSFYDFNS